MSRSRTFLKFFALLVALCLIQLGVMANRITVHRSTLRNGAVYRFKVTVPDTQNPIQGRYLKLRCHFDYPDDIMIHPHSRYGVLAVNSSGFAEITDIRLTRPPKNTDYIAIHMNRGSPGLYNEMLYLNKPVTPKTSDAYRNDFHQRDIHASIRVRRGHGIIENVFIDGIPVMEILNRQ